MTAGEQWKLQARRGRFARRLKRAWNRFGAYIDDVLFGEREHREVEWIGGAFIVLVFVFLVWQITR